MIRNELLRLVIDERKGLLKVKYICIYKKPIVLDQEFIIRTDN